MKLSIFLSSAFMVATVSAATDCSSSQQAVQNFERDVTDPTKFCDFWLAYPPKRVKSPFKMILPLQVSQICSCIEATPPVSGPGPTPTGNVGPVQCSMSNPAVRALEAAIADPSAFCKFWGTRYVVTCLSFGLTDVSQWRSPTLSIHSFERKEDYQDL